MPPLPTVLAIAVGGVVVAYLLLSLKRGSFGTPQRRAELELQGLADSSEVPKNSFARGPANSLGHSGRASQLRGMGILWLNDQTLGFVLRRPNRVFNIPLNEITSCVGSKEFSRVGFSRSSDDVSFLVVDWTDTSGAAVIGFELDEAERWAAEVNAAIKERRRLR